MKREALPEETWNQICEEVSEFKGKAASSTLYSIALVCRTALPSARKELSPQPLLSLSSPPSWPQAVSLFRTLSSCPHLALQVKSLSYLSEAVFEFLSQPSLHHTFEGVSPVSPNPQSWGESMIRLCTKAKAVSIYLDEVVRMTRIAKMVASRPDVQAVTLDCSQAEPHGILVAWTAAYNSPQVLLAPRWKLEIDISAAFTPEEPDIRPIDASDLSVTLQGLDWGPFSLRHLPFVAAFSSTSLRILSLSTFDERYGVYGEDAYRNLLGTAYLPPVFFSNFAHLVTFELKGFTNLHIGKFALLAASSAHLRTLSFATSTWSFYPSDFYTFIAPGPPPGKQQLLDVVRQMQNLEKLDLGILPYYHYSKVDFGLMVTLEDFCKVRKIELKTQGIYEEGDDDSEDDEDRYR